MSTEDELLGELDASSYFKSRVMLNLDELTDMEAVIRKFGYSIDDRIERRDLVQIFRRVESEIEAEIQNSATSGRYSNAKDLRGRLMRLRAQFDQRLGAGEVVMRQDQVVAFMKAKAKHNTALQERHAQQEQDMHDRLHDFEGDVELIFRIEAENLEKRIKRIVRPRIKYSKRVIELMKAETELTRLRQYDDAQKVRLMLQKIIPVERKAFYKAFDEGIETMRRDLATRQQADRIRAGEKAKGMTFNDIRRREKEHKSETARIKIHEHDMHHSHSVESKLRPEMSIKPSALWTKRPGYMATSASMRGAQLQDLVNGKKAGQQVFAETLVDRHTFDEGSLQDTHTYAMGDSIIFE